MGSNSKNKKSNNSNASEITPAAEKIVQNLKEILNKNCTDDEIYAALLDCNMNPDDAFQRLLSQDTFKEVKSKRERRKEKKETQESRTRSGVRFGSEQDVGQTGSIENNYNEFGKTAYNREMGSAAPSGSSSSSYMYNATGNILNEEPPIHSDFFNVDNRRQLIGTSDTISTSVQSSSVHQPTWAGVLNGQVSMADVVRGRPLNKGSQMSSEISCTSQLAVLPNSSHYHNKSPQVFSSPESEMHQDPYSSHPSTFTEMIPEYGRTAGQHDFDNEWPVIEHLSAATRSLVIDASAASDAEVYSYSDRAEFSRQSQPDDVQISERHNDSRNHSSNSNGSGSAPSRQIIADGAGWLSNNDLLKETSYDSHGHRFQEAVSSAVANIGKEELVMPPTENHSAVVLPNYLQSFAADCSHLSFGTYKSGVASSSSTAVASNPIESNLDVSAADGSSAMHSNFRNSEYQDDEPFGLMHDTQRVTADARNYNPLVSSQPELLKQGIPESTPENQYNSSLSFPDTSINNIQQSGSNFPFVVDPNAGNLPFVPSEMHLENIPSGFAPTRQSLRMRDSSPFLATQSMPSGYGSAVSSHPSIPMEVLNSGTFSLPQLAPHAVSGSDLARGAVLPQHQLVHSYSQSRLPSSELGNMISYPSMPQRQTYVPSALQQAYPEASLFHDSLSGMNYDLQQYRSSATMGGLPLSNNGPSAYGSFVGSSTIPRSFSPNQSALHMGAAVSYNDRLRSHYMDGNSLPCHQNNRSSTWDLGASRTSSIPSVNAYYSLLRQNQHRPGYQSDDQQASQESQHYESLGYPNTYQSNRITRTSAPRSW